ncbi:MAG: iron chelate uptake ABC transporter family permease subunit [Dehalococcoidia bacterium]|nr:iron chelate uptake ABC transporter family permease subunit [Dehalococcoidia bacterium]
MRSYTETEHQRTRVAAGWPAGGRKRSRLYALAGLALGLLVAVVGATFLGSVSLPLATVSSVLLSGLPFIDADPAWPTGLETIVLNIRLPRVMEAGVVGAALALAGATYQGLFRNPLADPYLIGVAQGAALGATVAFLTPLAALFPGDIAIPLFAFAGALAAVSVVYAVARVGRSLPLTTLILAGVAVGVFLSAVTSSIMLYSGSDLRHILFWLLGGFSLANWGEVGIIVPYVVLGTVVILAFSRSLNVLQLDEEQAQQLGVEVGKVKLILMVAATMITAAAVSFAGTIGFVGIIVPHMVRLLWGPDHRFLLPLSVLSGAVFLIMADTLARTAFSPHELPVGIVTAFAGAPFFLYLLRRRQRLVF